MAKQIKIDDVTATQYYKNYNDFLEGIMSREDWVDYASDLTLQIMEMNKDVFIRLKERD